MIYGPNGERVQSRPPLISEEALSRFAEEALKRLPFCFSRIVGEIVDPSGNPVYSGLPGTKIGDTIKIQRPKRFVPEEAV